MNIHELIKFRRTIRKFKQTPLSEEQIRKYIDAARVAPAAANVQPLKYIAVQSADMAEKVFPLVKWAGYLAPDYDPKPGERPVAYIVVCTDNDIRKGGSDMDVGASVENIILSALGDGVGACWMLSVDRPAIKELLSISDTLEVSCVVAMGYPAEEPREVEVTDGIKYYLGDDGRLCVPKRSMDDVLIDIV